MLPELESHPEPELVVGRGVEPESRVSSVPLPDNTVCAAGPAKDAPQAAQKRAPDAESAPQDGQRMAGNSTRRIFLSEESARILLGGHKNKPGRITRVDYAKARRHLMRSDPKLGSLVRRFG